MTVVITGASSGIGLELSKRYAKKASKLYLIARRGDALQELSNYLVRHHPSLSVEILPTDVTDFKKLIETSEHICRSSEKIDILIANAGISSEHRSDIYVFDDFKKIVETNFLSVAAMCEIFAKKMKTQQSGKIVLISSLASLVAFPTTAAYSASKRALNSFADSMRLLLKNDGISVINIQPGFIKTPLTDKNDFQMPFLMKLEHAASKIENAIAKNRAEYAFPFLFAICAKILSKMPHYIRDKIIKTANYEKHRPKRG